jgi:hypothetical protein
MLTSFPMTEDIDDIEAIVVRCLDDVAVAREVLAGDEYPDVRNAIIADLEDARGVEGQLNPQPLPPGEQGFAVSLWVRQERIWGRWNTLPRENLNRLRSR